VRKKAAPSAPLQYSKADLVIDSIQDKKGEDIVVLNLEGIPDSVSSRFIICQADSTTQVRAIALHVMDRVEEELGEKPYSVEGLTNCQWVLVDYIDVVVHVFHREQRHFYQLEDLWHDAAVQRIANFN
jgi:ribosome-associated protein